MKILIACEFSGIVRDAFIAKGHDAVDKGKLWVNKNNGRKRGGAWTMMLSPSPDRWKIRSRTFQGIAEAMAEQWAGNHE